MGLDYEPSNKDYFNYLSKERQDDFGINLLHLEHRFYDPVKGRFDTQDPVTDGQEHLSLYQYGWNNPVLKSDPNGLWPGEKIWNKVVDSVKSAAVWAGSVLTESSDLRKEYHAESSKLVEKNPQNNLKRLELKASVRDATPQALFRLHLHINDHRGQLQQNNEHLFKESHALIVVQKHLQWLPTKRPHLLKNITKQVQ